MRGCLKRGIFGLILIAGMWAPSFAQHKEKNYEQIEAIKVAFITKKVDLTSDEAQKFWPVYNNYQKELWALIRKRKEARSKTDVDPNAKLSADLEYEGRILELKKKYRKLYLKVIPPQKVLLVFQAEREFREHLIEQLKHRRKQE